MHLLNYWVNRRGGDVCNLGRRMVNADTGWRLGHHRQ